MENKYKIIAYLISTESDWQTESLGKDYEEVKKDYVFISDKENPFQERMRTLMKYNIDGDVEIRNEREEYIIDEDNDGLYLLKRI